MEVVDDDDYEEQEVLVYLDFGSKIDDDLLSLEKEFKLIGLESESPVLQLGNQVFQGVLIVFMFGHRLHEWLLSVGGKNQFHGRCSLGQAICWSSLGGYAFFK